MSKTRKKKKFQKRRKSKDNTSGAPRVSDAVNKRDERNFFKIAIIVTIVLIVAIYFFVIRSN